MIKGSERRELERVDYLRECLIESDALDGVKNGRISDLHCAGAFIDIMTPFPIGSVFGLRFRLRDTEIRVKAEVRYSLGNMGIGVRFLDLSDNARDLIENVLYNKPMQPRLVEPRLPESPTDQGWQPAQTWPSPTLDWRVMELLRN